MDSINSSSFSFPFAQMNGLVGQQLPEIRLCQLCEQSISLNIKESLVPADMLIFFCGHIFHKLCVDEFIQPIACPICNENPVVQRK